MVMVARPLYAGSYQPANISFEAADEQREKFATPRCRSPLRRK